jgi:hypothetical protein
MLAASVRQLKQYIWMQKSILFVYSRLIFWTLPSINQQARARAPIVQALDNFCSDQYRIRISMHSPREFADSLERPFLKHRLIWSSYALSFYRRWFG